MKKVSKKFATYSEFSAHITADIQRLIAIGSKQRLCDARIKADLLALFKENADKNGIFPYLETANGNIREDYIINAITYRYKNVHIFATNPPYIEQYENSEYTIYVVLKRTKQGIYRVPTKNVIDKRLSLSTLMSIKGIKKFKKLQNALGLVDYE